ncbi:OmpA family protein [Duganella sp. Root1480D1]|uniref:OmpA family protein n=1 Tax=Duganella sp. Root1480D1 TaxID=1736471 RepID=UPI00070B9D09|nr:OmpA family protein [Duganella sp. Root1480D1]KQZ30383.1 flagellar motor protein MotB [Duganella sp. Root1480D1]
MFKPFLKPTALAAALALAACSTTPTTTNELEVARADYAQAQGNPMVAKYASAELAAATRALDQANTASARNESLQTIDKLAYIAKQKIASAQEIARAKSAEDQLKDAASQRDQVRLQARTAEAEAAQRRADQARMDAENAQNQAASAEAATRDAQARAAALAAALSELQAKQTERGIVITFGDVLFNVDQANLTPQGMAIAQRLADVLRDNPDRTVLVEGFTDSTGSDAYNLQLSQRRAEAIRMALGQMGIERSRIETRGYGEAYPVASNATAGERQMNRRVEIVLSEAGRPVTQRR